MIVKQKKMDKRINYKLNLDTIFASASSIGLSAIKTIRISGNETKIIFKTLTKKNLPKPRYCKLLNLYDLKNSSVIDKAIVVWFPASKTYTGENMLEINIHGGNSVLEHLVENLLLIRNVREADPGEFTKRAFKNNEDIHLLTASQVFNIPLNKIDDETRRKAKAINFGIIYGISQYGLAKQISVSNQEAADFLKSYFKKFPEIKDYMNTTINFCRKSGYVNNIFGRRCYIAGINDKNYNVRN